MIILAAWIVITHTFPCHISIMLFILLNYYVLALYFNVLSLLIAVYAPLYSMVKVVSFMNE